MNRSAEPSNRVTDEGKRPLGAVMTSDHTCSFQVWAPRTKELELHITFPSERMVAMHAAKHGYFYADVPDVSPGALYFYRFEYGRERPDPASRFQPEGVHGPSQVVAGNFSWSDGAWSGLPLDEYALYELHVGTFTPEGTFDAIIPRIDALKELGITAIELMPVAQFPGSRNWGYDGVYPYAVQASYGGPEALFLRRWSGPSQIFAVFNFHAGPVQLSLPIPVGLWRKQLDSAEPRWRGSGSQTPDVIDSTGDARMAISGSTLCFFSQTGKNHK